MRRKWCTDWGWTAVVLTVSASTCHATIVLAFFWMCTQWAQICDTRQPTAEKCVLCGTAFGAYTCLKCCFFDDQDKKQFQLSA